MATPQVVRVTEPGQSILVRSTGIDQGANGPKPAEW